MGVVTSRAVPSVARVRSAAFCAICSSVGESLIVCCRATMGDTMSSGADGGGSANRFSRSIAFGCAATLPSVSAMPGSAPVGTPKLDPTTLSVVGAALSSGTKGPCVIRSTALTPLCVIPPPKAPDRIAVVSRFEASDQVISGSIKPLSSPIWSRAVTNSDRPSAATCSPSLRKNRPGPCCSSSPMGKADGMASDAPDRTPYSAASFGDRPSSRPRP